MHQPRSHQELSRRIQTLAALAHELDLGDGQVSRIAVQDLAETLGYYVVIMDSDPEQKLEDLGREYQRQLQELVHRPGTRSEALRVGLDVADQVLGVLRDAVGRQGRTRGPQPVRRLRAGGH